MNPEEYDRLAAVERDHWFYRGKRTIVRRWIERYGSLSAETKLLDVGTGTGLFASEMAHQCQVIGVDDHEEALEYARRREKGQFVRARSNELPFEESHFDVVTSLDVLEHLPDDLGSLKEINRVLKPGGVAVITVPAFRLLWSEWDVVLHHQRRYRRWQIIKLAQDVGMEVVTARYMNSLMFVPVVVYRKLREWTPLFKGGRRAEDQVPSPWINRILETTFVEPACWRWFHPPFGVSVIAALRKPVKSLKQPTGA
jgi:ubiquinone/menaquinone biosynthesis C-methylase UbiE